jgi:VanZ family protein
MIRSLSRDAALAAAVTIAVVAIVSFAPPPEANRLSGDSHDFAHVVVFGVFGLFFARALRRAPGGLSERLRVIVFTLTLGLVFGVATELVQQYTGGWLSRGDVVRDVLGTAIGLCIAFALERATATPLRTALWSGAALGLVAAFMPLAGTLLDYRARQALFPVLVDPAAPRSLRFVTGFGTTYTVGPLPDDVVESSADAAGNAPGPLRTATHPGSGPLGLRVPLDRGSWPGVTLEEPEPDWRGWQRFVVDVANPDDQPLSVVVRVNDQQHVNRYEDRFDVGVELPPRTRRRLVFRVDAIEAAPRGRRMDLSQVEKIVVHHTGPAPGRVLYVMGMWLEH